MRSFLLLLLLGVHAAALTLDDSDYDGVDSDASSAKPKQRAAKPTKNRKPHGAAPWLGYLKMIKAHPEKAWHGPKVVCAGWKKTGTTSMAQAYEWLGIAPVAHGWARGYCRDASCMYHFAATEDMPTCCDRDMIKDIKQSYQPNVVKFVLTVRRPERWKKSIDAWMIKKPDYHARYGFLMGAKYGTPAFYEGYEKHNAYVKSLFKDQPERLLVLNLEDDDPVANMQKFCKFMGISNTTGPAHWKCNRPFPRANSHATSAKEAEQIRRAALPASERNLKVNGSASEQNLQVSDPRMSGGMFARAVLAVEEQNQLAAEEGPLFDGEEDEWLHVDEDPNEFEQAEWEDDWTAEW